MKKKVSYIIPTYNEAENIAPMIKVVDSIFKKLKKYEYKILVVDDNSPDGTGKIVRQIAKNNKNIILLPGQKKGLGAAMIRGLKHSLKIKSDFTISNEADFSYSPREIPRILKKLDSGWDVVACSRIISGHSKWSLGRQTIHFIANNVFAEIVAGVTEVEDHNSAYKAINNTILGKLDFNDFPKGFSFFNYFIYQTTLHTNKICEIKTKFTPRTKGQSKIGLNSKYIKYFLKDSLEYVASCARIRLQKMNLL